MTRFLFVCTGNICRSPTADAVMRHYLRAANLWFYGRVDSAGTHDYHPGHPPDIRTVKAGRARGYDLTPLRARAVTKQDFMEFDEIMAMDRGHLAFLQRMQPAGSQAKVGLFLDFLPGYQGQDVPDPYYGSGADFEKVLDLIVPTIKIILKEKTTVRLE